MKNIVIIGGTRDYHVMGWYRTIKQLASNRKVVFLTDLINSEGYEVLVNQSDHIEKLFIIDKFLFSKQSRWGNIWRNFFKLLVLPIQVIILKNYVRKNPHSIFHAQPMYYMLLCWISGVKYIGTPQGSEILVRPWKSKLYKLFAVKSLQAANSITVDSVNLQKKIHSLSGVTSKIIQYGVETEILLRFAEHNLERKKIVSLRGMTQLYRIKEIVLLRNKYSSSEAIHFIYPFGDEKYHKEVSLLMNENDVELGRLSKNNMYQLLAESFLVISIPTSDSSPRSVYEAIFLGCCVAVTYNPYIDILPNCMRERMFIIDLDDSAWFINAVNFANEIKTKQYTPSEEAINMFDQTISMQKAIEILYS